MARTVRFASYLMGSGELPVYEGFGGPVFHYSRGAWRLLEPVGVRLRPDEGNELCGDSKYELLSRLLRILLELPDGPDLVLAAVRSYHKLRGDGEWFWVLHLALIGLPNIELEDGMDRTVVELPSWIRLEPGPMDELARSFLVSDVMES